MLLVDWVEPREARRPTPTLACRDPDALAPPPPQPPPPKPHVIVNEIAQQAERRCGERRLVGLPHFQ